MTNSNKKPVLFVLGIFTLGSALCAFAPSVQALIAFRVFQGIGGGALLPVAMAIIFRLFDPTGRADDGDSVALGDHVSMGFEHGSAQTSLTS